MPPAKRRDIRRSAGAKSDRLAHPTIADATAKTWRQVAKALESDVVSGRFGGSGRLPPEAQLARELGLSRHTLRRAITSLVARGILRSVPHIGTFVAPQRIAFTLTATSRLIDAVQEAGLNGSQHVISQRICKPPAETAKLIGIAARTDVIEIMLLIRANETVLGCMTFWLAADRFRRVGELIEATGSLKRALAQVGISNYRRRSMRIVSRFADPIERDGMKLAVNAIVFAIEGVSADDAGEPTHGFRYVLDASRIALEIAP